MTPELKRMMRHAASELFSGIAIPSLQAIADEYVIEGEEYVYGTGINGTVKFQRYAVCEKLLKFRRKKRKKVARFKANPKMCIAAKDCMRDPIGEPGSQERIAAMAERMATWEKEERSLFDEAA
jgi:hypothetical protein